MFLHACSSTLAAPKLYAQESELYEKIVQLKMQGTLKKENKKLKNNTVETYFRLLLLKYFSCITAPIGFSYTLLSTQEIISR